MTPKQFAAAAAKLAKLAPVQPLAEALGALVTAKATQPKLATVTYKGSAYVAVPALPPRPARQRRARRGRMQRYTMTGKRNDARLGTFRHHMLAMVLAAGDTWAAERLHADSGQHSGKKLDFSWAAANGYITLI